MSFRRRKLKKPYVEVSGRKGFGVKADDLIDKLEAATLPKCSSATRDMDATSSNAPRTRSPWERCGFFC